MKCFSKAPPRWLFLLCPFAPKCIGIDTSSERRLSQRRQAAKFRKGKTRRKFSHRGHREKSLLLRAIPISCRDLCVLCTNTRISLRGPSRLGAFARDGFQNCVDTNAPKCGGKGTKPEIAPHGVCESRVTWRRLSSQSGRRDSPPCLECRPSSRCLRSEISPRPATRRHQGIL